MKHSTIPVVHSTILFHYSIPPNVDTREIPYTKPTLSNLNDYMYECVHERNSFVCVQVLSFTELFQPGSNSSGCPHLLLACRVEESHPDSGLTDC